MWLRILPIGSRRDNQKEASELQGRLEGTRKGWGMKREAWNCGWPVPSLRELRRPE